MNVRVPILFAVWLVGCGKLEIGAYPAAEEDPGSSGVGFAGRRDSGGAPGGAGRGGFAGAGDGGGVPVGGSGSGGFAGGGFASGGGGAGNDAGMGGSADTSGGGNAGNGSGNGGSSGSFAGGGSGGDFSGGAGGSAGGGGIGGGGSGGSAGGVIDQSCRGLMSHCAEVFSCCDARFVETQEFDLGYAEWTVNARVTMFYPDTYEVTVGRFARFVEAFDEWRAHGHPGEGAAEHTFIQGTGWQSDWPLAESREELERKITSCPFVSYPLRDQNLNLPMNCVNWYEAFAFCAWDGKRLLTEAEWELIAKGGNQDRTYPWGNEEPTPDHAVYGCTAVFPGAPHCEAGDLLAVGSKPLGTSLHGLSDMGGSVAEWVFDKVADSYRDPCNDCVTTESHLPNNRGFRGGGYSSHPNVLAAEMRNTMDTEERYDHSGRLNFLGFRCGRSLTF
jgi:formylglycine-generating enzyme